jgi:hypothetical protein
MHPFVKLVPEDISIFVKFVSDFDRMDETGEVPSNALVPNNFLRGETSCSDTQIVPSLMELVPELDDEVSEKLSKAKGMLLSLTKPQLYIWKKGMVVAGKARHRSSSLQS